MFKVSDFRVRKRFDYPYFDKVIQSWYTPILSKTKNDDGNYSACVTLGVSSNQIHDKNEVMVVSVFNQIIPSSVEFLKHVECLCGDYLNKKNICIKTSRTPGVVIFEAEKGKHNKIISRMKVSGIFRFYPEYHGGEELEDRIQAVKPLTNRVLLTHMPNTTKLRPDDAELMGRLLAYPSCGSFAIASAYTQAVLYAQYSQLFDDGKDVAAQSGPKHAFY